MVAKRRGQLFNKDLWIFEFTYRSCDLRCGRLQFVVLRDTATSFIWTIRLRIDVVAEEGDQSVNTVTGTFGLTSRRRLLVLRLRLFGCWLRILRLFGGLWWTVYFHFAGLRGRLKERQTNRHDIRFALEIEDSGHAIKMDRTFLCSGLLELESGRFVVGFST